MGSSAAQICGHVDTNLVMVAQRAGEERGVHTGKRLARINRAHQRVGFLHRRGGGDEVCVTVGLTRIGPSTNYGSKLDRTHKEIAPSFRSKQLVRNAKNPDLPLQAQLVQCLTTDRD